MTGMRALRFGQHGGPEVLEVATIDVPRPAAGEVLVRVRAAGLNPVDTGFIRQPLPFVTGFTLPGVPGWDVAGTVVALGPETEGFKTGDDVFGCPGSRASPTAHSPSTRPCPPRAWQSSRTSCPGHRRGRCRW